ncbi:MAG: hypothetical protein M1407_01265 [Deltaproteobacteria bacterium]|nr:hypothetical protein [Deltaproteobacteria bacterium]
MSINEDIALKLQKFLYNAIGKNESIINTPKEDAFTKDLNNRLNKGKGGRGSQGLEFRFSFQV